MFLMDDFVKRLNYLIDREAEGKYSVFAKKCGIPHATFYKYTKGRMPHMEHLVRIKRTLNIDLNWLLIGQGEPYLNVSMEIGEPDPDSISNNVIEMDHETIIKQFTDKQLAREIDLELVKIERLDKTQFREIGAYIKGVAKGLTRPCPVYNGPDRRLADRRKGNHPDKLPMGQDRRSGKDRRKVGAKG